MEISSDQLTLEMLPDEILLEVCKYLLCSDVLHSFMGLNQRMTQMIVQYRQDVSFYKTSITKFDYLCVHVLPQIGSQIRSLFIDSNHSLLQDRLFINYFGDKMSITFPNLQRIRINIVSCSYEAFVALLNTLHDLDQLVEIRLHIFFSSQSFEQSALARILFQTNNHRLTTVFIDHHSSSLCVDPGDRYLNILRLCIKLKTKTDLLSLLAAIPNVQYLDVFIGRRVSAEEITSLKLGSPLLHLTHFSLKCMAQSWTLEELMALLALLPFIRSLSLVLRINDERLVRGDVILHLLPPTVQQFNYAIYLIADITLDADTTIVSSWPPSHPIAYFFDDIFLFLHTLPWHFFYLQIPSSVGRMITVNNTIVNGYDKHVEQVVLVINETFSLGKSLMVLSQCHRAREVTIHIKGDSNVLKEEQFPASRIPELSRVGRIWFRGLIPSDHTYFSIILNALPNLFRLDLSFAHLLKLIEDPAICSMLSQRITTLAINENDENSSSTNVNEEHLPVIASIFSRLRDMYIDVMHLPSSRTKISFKDILERSIVQNISSHSNQVEEKVIIPLSSESMLLCLLTAFQEHKLLALCMEGQFVDEVKTDTERWLRANSILAERHFAASFDSELNVILIWM